MQRAVIAQRINFAFSKAASHHWPERVGISSPSGDPRASLRGEGIGKVRTWNGVNGSLEPLSDSAASDLEVVL